MYKFWVNPLLNEHGIQQLVFQQQEKPKYTGEYTGDRAGHLECSEAVFLSHSEGEYRQLAQKVRHSPTRVEETSISSCHKPAAARAWPGRYDGCVSSRLDQVRWSWHNVGTCTLLFEEAEPNDGSLVGAPVPHLDPAGRRDKSRSSCRWQCADSCKGGNTVLCNHIKFLSAPILDLFVCA